MENKAQTYEEAAIECAAQLSPEDIEYFRLHISYYQHHFGYGLYLRNKYLYLLDDDFDIFGEILRENIGNCIYYLMLPILFPEFKKYEKYIERITERPFDDLNANYYLKSLSTT